MTLNDGQAAGLLLGVGDKSAVEAERTTLCLDRDGDTSSEKANEVRSSPPPWVPMVGKIGVVMYEAADPEEVVGEQFRLSPDPPNDYR